MKNLKIVSRYLVLVLMAVILKTGSGSANTFILGDKRDLSSYNQLELEGAFEVTLVQGNEESVIVEAAPEVASLIITKVEGGTLKIYPDKKLNSNSKIALTINFKTLKAIDCSGAIDITGSGAMKFEELSFDASGACKATLEINATSLHMDISGAGKTTFSGKVSQVNLDISGAGKFMAASLEADSYDIDISGSGNAEVNAAKMLDVEVSGSGNVKYTGNPKISQDISGTGQVIKM